MHYLRIALLAICFWCGIIVLGCSSQSSNQKALYPDCEPRSNTDPGRLNFRVEAENYGAIEPCDGTFEIYINQNSEVRSLDLHLEYLNMSDRVLSEEQIRVDLEDTPTGMFQKAVSLGRVEEESCRNVQINIQSMTCLSADGSVVECPEVRIHRPDTYRFIKVEDESVEVCSSGS